MNGDANSRRESDERAVRRNAARVFRRAGHRPVCQLLGHLRRRALAHARHGRGVQSAEYAAQSHGACDLETPRVFAAFPSEVSGGGSAHKASASSDISSDIVLAESANRRKPKQTPAEIRRRQIIAVASVALKMPVFIGVLGSGVQRLPLSAIRLPLAVNSGELRRDGSEWSRRSCERSERSE